MAPRAIRSGFRESLIPVVAIKAFLHLHFSAPALVYFIHRTVTGLARNTRLGMDSMMKNDVIRKECFHTERFRRSFGKNRVQSFNSGLIRERQIMAIHTVRFRGHKGPHGNSRPGMAFGAIQPESIAVHPMAERNPGIRSKKGFRRRTQIPHGKSRARKRNDKENDIEFDLSLEQQTPESFP